MEQAGHVSARLVNFIVGLSMKLKRLDMTSSINVQRHQRHGEFVLQERLIYKPFLRAVR
jgi:hypothetical protein